MSSVEAALAALRDGRPVLVTDDADREDEGDVVLAAQHVSTEWIAWTVRHTSGLLCAPMPAERADALALPAMVSNNQDPKQTAYTVTVDAARGVSTGISAADRATTLRTLADSTCGPTDLIRPGHILPLRAKPGGVLERPGHTEAAVDLCRLAELAPVAAIAELVADDGSMLARAGILDLGARQGLPVLTVAELIRHRQRDGLTTVVRPSRALRVVDTTLPTDSATFRMIGYRDQLTGAEIVALTSGPISDGMLVRVHSECITGESLGSQRCECGPQLNAALAAIARDGGALVYLRGHEGRGIGLLKKLSAYRLQDDGLDTAEANLALGESVDGREYGGAAAVLEDLGAGRVRLMTNNPAKVEGLESHGIAVQQRVPLHVGATSTNVRYLETKYRRMGHIPPGACHNDPLDAPTLPWWPLANVVGR